MCKDLIKIVTFHKIDEATLHFLQLKLHEIFKIEVVVYGQLTLPTQAFNALRRQYLASSLLEVLLYTKGAPNEIVLGVTNEDLYEPNLNFVFGIATPLYGLALISTKRLHNSFYGLEEDDELYLRRVLTEAVHEIGHTLGLAHCPNPHCVMHFSNTLQDTDKKGYRFCPSCWEKAKQGLCI